MDGVGVVSQNMSAGNPSSAIKALRAIGGHGAFGDHRKFITKERTQAYMETMKMGG